MDVVLVQTPPPQLAALPEFPSDLPLTGAIVSIHATTNSGALLFTCPLVCVC